MGYNKDNYKRIRAEYETKTFRAQEEAEARRAELYAAIPELKAMDERLASFGLRIMEAALHSKDTQAEIAALRAENERITHERAELLRKNIWQRPISKVWEAVQCPIGVYILLINNWLFQKKMILSFNICAISLFRFCAI